MFQYLVVSVVNFSIAVYYTGTGLLMVYHHYDDNDSDDHSNDIYLPSTRDARMATVLNTFRLYYYY